MSSHPMLQPVSWTPQAHPDVVKDNLSNAQGGLYRIIYDCALACCLKSPVLTHSRHVWRFLGGYAAKPNYIASAQVSPVHGKEGYWLLRQDFPSFAWPVERSPFSSEWGAGDIDVMDVRVSNYVKLSEADLFSIAQLQGITGSFIPVAWKELFGDSKTHDSPALISRDTIDGMSITQKGRSLLSVWRDHGLVGRGVSYSLWASKIEAGELSYRQALDELSTLSALNDEYLEPIADQIEDLCSTWEGMTRAASEKVKSNLQVEAPIFTGLPSWIDPEKILPADHPLRLVKKSMEIGCHEAHPNWSFLAAQTQAELRLQWIADHYREFDDCSWQIQSVLEEDTGQYNSLRYWLTGMKRNGRRFQDSERLR